MLRAILFFVQLAIVLVVAVWLAENPGRITVDWLGYRVDTYFALVLIALAVLLGVVMFAYRFWRGFVTAPGSFLRGRAARRRDEGYKALMHGMAAVAAGDAAEAKRMSRRADGLLHDPGLTRLLQAQAAALNGDVDAAARYFTALADETETEFLGVTGLMRLAKGRGDEKAMRELAERARRLRPDAPFVLETLFDLQTRAGLWSDAARTLYDAVRAGAIPEDVGRGHRTAILAEQALRAERDGKPQDAMALVDQAQKALSDFVPAAALKARLQTALGRARRAARDTEAFWRHTPHPEVAAAYAGIWPSDTAKERLMRLQTLVQPNADVFESRIAVAEAALEADLWGEARKQLEAIPADERTQHVYRLLARLEEAENRDLVAARALLDRAAAAAPDASWTCGDCGAVAASWSALCGNCGRFDTLAWKQPPRIHALPPARPAKTEAVAGADVGTADATGEASGNDPAQAGSTPGPATGSTSGGDASDAKILDNEPPPRDTSREASRVSA